jgi:hypothetical protein
LTFSRGADIIYEPPVEVKSLKYLVDKLCEELIIGNGIVKNITRLEAINV